MKDYKEKNIIIPRCEWEKILFFNFREIWYFFDIETIFLEISFGDSRIYLMNGFIPRNYACIRIKNIKRLHVFEPRTLKF